MSERSAIEMPSADELAAAISVLSVAAHKAADSMRECVIAMAIAAADMGMFTKAYEWRFLHRRRKLIRQMVAKARGRNWRTVR